MSKKIDPVEVSGNQLKLVLDIRGRLFNVAYGRRCEKSPVTRFISTASSNGCSPCCCVSKSCGQRPSRVDPFGRSPSFSRISHPVGGTYLRSTVAAAVR